MSNTDDGTGPTIGERIRELRQSAYTQGELAVAADLSVDVVRKLEQGRRQTASIGAPEWTGHHRLPRMLIGELLTKGHPSSRLRALASRLNVRPGTTTIAHHDE